MNQNGFNPLAGIRCFLTNIIRGIERVPSANCFNPLAGIRCFLTQKQLRRCDQPPHPRFQSPSGDSLFSDAS